MVRSVAEVRAEISATVRRVRAEPGRPVAVGDELIVLETMQTQIPVLAPVGGTVTEVLVAPDGEVAEGDVVAVIDET